MVTVLVSELAGRLGVSKRWVQEHAVALGGAKDKKGRWMFLDPEVYIYAHNLMIGSGMKQTVVATCPRCGTDRVLEKGRLGRRVVIAPHLPGYCWDEDIREVGEVGAVAA